MNINHKKIFFTLSIFILLFIIIFPSNNIVFAKEENNDIQSSAKAMYLFDANSGRELYKKNSDEKLAMASTTKICTAITVLENYNDDLDKKIEVPSEAVGLEGTSMYIKHGELLSVRELLYGLMLPSGNDAGKALSIIVAGSEDEFAKLMNETAKKAGAENSSFMNAHGLDTDGHYTTAKDLALITAYALKNDDFVNIVSTKNVVIEKTNKYETRYFKNKNKLLFDFDDCIGVKTGFTDNAGRCLVTATNSDNLKLVCVVLNCPDMFEESSRLIKKAKNEYTAYKIIDKENCIDTINVLNGKSNTIRVCPIEDFIYPLTQEEYNNIEIKTNYPQEVKAPINVKDKIGNIEVFVKDCLIFSTDICSIDSVKSLAIKDLLDEIISNWS